MALLNVSGGVTITLLKNGESVNTSLNSTSPLYQTFKKGTQDFNPNWATMPDANRPVIFPRVFAAMQGIVLTAQNITWKYNTQVMTFDAQGVCTAPDICAGKIKQIDHEGAKALKLIGNVASDTNNDSDTVTFSGNVTSGGQTIQVTAEATILVEEAASTLYRLFLNMTDDVIDGEDASVTMTAQLFNSGVEVTTGVQYEFTDISGNVLKAKSASNTLVVTRAMVDSELMVVCKAYVNSAVVAQEQRKVWDGTDPYVIACDKGNNNRQSALENVDYMFSLMNMRTSAVVPGKVFAFKVFKNSTLADITSQFTKTNTAVTVPGAKISEHGSIFIEASTTVEL